MRVSPPFPLQPLVEQRNAEARRELDSTKPTWDELVRRLIGRGTEDAAEQQRRLETAKVELAAQDEFDVKVVNHDVAEAAREVVELMTASDDARQRD